MGLVRIDVEPLLRPWTAQLATRAVVVEQGAVACLPGLLTALLPAGPWLLVADPITWSAAGEAAAAALHREGLEVTRHLLLPAVGVPVVVAADGAIDALAERLRLGGYRAAVAVGAGTVNDMVKLAATQAGIPYAVVATAPSMNGYTSSLAAPLQQGVKTTVACRPPVACVVDVDVVAAAPMRMLVAGLGDLLSKPVSNADWRLAHRVVGAPYAPAVMDLIDAGAALLEGVAGRLPRRDPEAVGRLAASLCISGLAMGLAGSSAPASGAEHLISHYLDMTHYAAGEPHDLHGCQVGVATLTTAALYEVVRSWDPRSLDRADRLARHPEWSARALEVEQRFGSLAPAVLPQARQAHPTRDELARRLDLLSTQWDDILAEVATTLRPARALAAQLRAAGAPVTYAELGISDDRARTAVLAARDIRPRYTVLHLAADLGQLPHWVDRALARGPLLASGAVGAA